MSLPWLSPYSATLVVDMTVFLFLCVSLLLAKRRSWLGAFSPVVFRLASLSLLVRIAASFAISVRTYVLVVAVSNFLHAFLWLWAFRSLDSLIRSPEIRAVQIWVHARKVEIVSIYKRLQGEISVLGPSKASCGSGCAICLQNLTPRSGDRRSLSVRRRASRLSTPNRSNSYAGVVRVLTTPCRHKFHAACLARCVDRLCPLCKGGVGVVARATFPFP